MLVIKLVIMLVIKLVNNVGYKVVVNNNVGYKVG